MNPKPGDTVNPTKSTTSKATTSTKTSTTTTGELASGSSQPRTDNNTKPGARKRRQGQLAQDLQSSLSPPRKSRRRAESPGPVGQTSPASKSRIGGFFSHLASRIRGTRSMEEATLAKRKGKKNQPIDGETSDDEVDNRKRRKSDPDECAGGLASQEANEKDQPAAEECDSTEAKAAVTHSPQSAPVSPSSPACKRRVSVKAGNPAAIAEEADEELSGICKEIIEQLTQTIEGGKVPSEPLSKPGAGDNRDPGTEGFISAGKRESSASGIIAAGKRKYASLKADLASKSAKSALRLQSEADKVPRFAAGRWRKDEAERLRGTIQWLEDGARRLREELARTRSELHEERRASKILRKEFESALRKMREAEAAKWSKQIAELRSKVITSPSRTLVENQTSQTKLNQMKDDNHKREILVLKNRLTEAEATVQRLKSDGLVKNKKKPKEEEKVPNFELQKLGVEVQSLRAANKQLEEKLQKAEESIKARTNELREEHKNHETQMKALKRGLRADTIILIDEIQSKNREIDRLEKLVSQMVQTNDKLRIREEETMRKLRESEKTHQTRLAPKLEEKIRREDDTHEVDQCKVECEEEEEDVEPTEIDRLRELAIEQQEVIEALRQAVKEKERKLDQLTKKRHKEEYYKQWYNLEPVAEVEDEDEEESEAGDSALSSAPSSLSPQPNAGCGRGGCSAGQNSVARETYESALFELEELQTKLLEEQSELGHARDQVRELEKALLQETRGSQSSRLALNEKLRLAGEREASLLAEISELREQNELLEFRVLELEESPNSRDTPDPADSGIVSPEPIHLYKEQQSNKHRDRAVATVIPYTPTYSSQSSVLSSDTQKSPLSLQESGIFEEEVEEPEYEQPEDKEPRCQSTQTEAPSGELLQEVQRLQELRARIQERGAKLPGQLSPVGERKGCGCEASSLRDCVRELEARLGSLDAERQLSKQREEEILDENYRLTERLYCLEAEIKNLETAKPSVDVGVGTDAPPQSKDACQQCDQEVDEVDAGDKECAKCGELWQGCQTRIEELGRTESGLRQQIAGLEQREAAFFETLRQADATWAKLEADYETKQREMSERLEAQLEINRSLFEQLGRMSKAEEKLDGKPDEECKCQRAEQSISRLAATTGVVVRADPARVATISRTNIKMPMIGCDIDDQLRELPSPPTEMATEAKEGDPSLRLATSIDIPGVEASHPETKQELQEALVSISKSPDDKKNYSKIITPRGFKRANSAGQEARREFLALCLGP